ncbi:MAG: hypothetical protein HFH95_06510 [Lachnospiraceae bacterium]|nr:hypothetical protein [uncultured Acetatifactor sp.]MCI8542951.1 hypothetical protein [Lachnospiraceae bacterium]
MRRKYAKAIAAALIMTMVSGCGNAASPRQDAGDARGQDASGMGVGGAAAGADETGGAAAGSQASGDLDGDGQTGDGGKPVPLENDEPEVYEEETLYTQKENILPIAESAAAWGISYKIEKAEYTESFGDRNLEHLENYLSEARTDSQGNLSGDYKYLFLTITFTNTTDEFQDINRNAGGIIVIGDSLNTLLWSNDVVYYDTYWEEGGAYQFHHWGLEPGESVTSEVGWVIEGCDSMTKGEGNTLAERIGSAGPYELYYQVKKYDGDNEGSFFIDLGVKVE